ncbi:outer membrane beta-barrel protein [Pollutibacter soli]|uniref:outer membrane beta-barrel protein n=1 Tax=Pollutibacter soli TaxID=3034157 RepID=UPI003013ED2F
MPDNSFEKKVSDKLNDFGLSPTPRVWEGVESHLHSRKKKDRWILWLFLGLLLIGGAGYFMYNSSEPGIETGFQASVKDANGPGKSNPSDNSNNQNANPIESDNSTNERASKEEKNSSARSDEITGKSNQPENSITIVDKSDDNTKSEKLSSKSTYSKQKRNSGGNKISELREVNVEKEMSNESSAAIVHAGEQPIKNSNSEIIDQKDQAADLSNTTEKKNETTAELKRPDSLSDQKIPIKKAETASAKKLKTKDPQKKWQFGVSANVGLTGLPESFTVATQKSFVADNLSVGNFPVSPAALPAYFPYSQEQSTGWGAGVWARIDIGKKSSLSAGLLYQYYSTTTTTGYQASGNISVNNGYTNMALRSYYLPGTLSEYRNRYHLLQVPLNYRITFGKSKLLPLSLVAGLQPGYIMGSNALLKDTSGVLYTNIGNFNRFQLGVNGGVQLRLFNKSKMPLDIGPVFQYQLTDAFRKNVGYSGHLLFVGLQADWQIFNLQKKQRQ